MPNSSLSFLLTCSRVLKDQPTGLFSYVDIFDELAIPKNNEFIIHTFCVAGKLNTDIEGEIKLETSFKYPDGTDSPSAVIGGAIKSGYLQFAVRFNMIKFTQTGRYYLKVRLQNEDLDDGNKFFFEVKKHV